ncbi:10596_t:CDS:2 [Funneliformis geosporum]|uniref:Serine/threonine-protein phosphatase 2A activator n=1 Tax=Funneliformis geosporum TaxID=1117311 RepID=A0A9W4WSH9_9GLOM|nr:10596_t:CDS:2 [Funneliformis geosporum]CAI2175335.1 13589_t:CDS:2 [Funneliformis geosporum]
MADNFTISTEHEFIEPIKRINNQADVDKWVLSEAFVRLMKFIESLNESVINHENPKPCHVSEMTQKVINLLETLLSWIDEIPPLPTPQRFGNKAYRTWVTRLEQKAIRLHQDILPTHLHGAIIELVPYFNGGFGNATRIDYGSGHELSFVTWLCCLNLIGVFRREDYTAIVIRIFTKYLNLVRRLQRIYMLEPAGSHGVWGLDDHQFLSYYWGSAQLRDHRNLKPKSILSEDLVNMYAEEYIYFECIKYIHEIKRGPFHEHSPLLHEISGVIRWTKVNSGLLKMYVADVLKKFPIVQHFLFGSLLPFKESNEIIDTRDGDSL